ncbi:hypothetical protein M426DRAFT_140316 [Hypoxylon sp. CI-4A]|nr:hypothetical protein M426DRAFT_140316 [Hypoxylon sp. CI-4A]
MRKMLQLLRSLGRWLRDVKPRLKRRKRFSTQLPKTDPNPPDPPDGAHQATEQSIEAETPQELPDSQGRPPDQEVPLANDDASIATQLPRNDSQVSNDVTPIWTRSKERFRNERPTFYEMTEPLFTDIRNLAVDDWDTWLNKRDEESTSTWFRRCKAYLPQLKSLKTVASQLGNLDPHKIAPLVIAGAFFVVEVCFETVDPSTRDTALTTMLEANIIVTKWLDSEPDLKLMKKKYQSSDIEPILEDLYVEILDLIFTIYRSGKTRGSRATTVLVRDIQEWDRKFKLLKTHDSHCAELKRQVEVKIKRLEDVLKWIKPGSEDPEPAHQTVKERTGVDGTESKAGRWFLETEEFITWIYQIRANEADASVFWLNGSMGTGKTTLLCRVISHFKEHPQRGVRFLYYYCFGSQAATESKAPTYEIILRALCYQLAQNTDGSLAEPAESLYHCLEENGRRSEPLTKNRLEELLRELLRNSHSTATSTLIVIDALDECKGRDDSDMLLTFLRGVQRELGNVYFLFSSRPHIKIGDHFEGSIKRFYSIQPQTKRDISDFIKSRIELEEENAGSKNSIFRKY